MRSWRFGFRLAWGARGRTLFRAFLIGLGVAFLAGVVATTVELIQADDAQHARAYRTALAVSVGQPKTFHARIEVVPFHGRAWTTIFVAGAAGAPSPPGVAHFPRPGETFISPALQRLAASNPLVAHRTGTGPTRTIESDGLQSPDQLLMYVGEPGDRLGASVAATGWGSESTPIDVPLIPASGLLVTVAALIGVPVLLLGASIARVASTERRRRGAALYLLGMSRANVANAMAAETACYAFVGAVAGILTIIALTPALASSQLLGFKWFASDTVMRPAEFACIALGLVAIVSGISRAGTYGDLRKPVAARWDSVNELRWERLIPLLVGVSLLLGIVILGATDPNRPLASGPVSVLMVMGDALAAVGLALCLPVIFRFIGERGLRRALGVPGSICFARLRFCSQELGRCVAPVAFALMTSIVGLAVLADLRSLTVTPDRNLVTVQEPALDTTQGLVRAASVPTGATIAIVPLHSSQDLPVTQDGAAPTLLVGTCKSLEVITRHALSTGQQPCRDGTTFRVLDAPQLPADTTVAETNQRVTTASTYLTLGATIGSALDGAALIYTLPSQEGAKLSSRGMLLSLPTGSADDYSAAVLAAFPNLDLNYLGIDIDTSTRVPVINRVVLACLGLGLLVAIVGTLVSLAERSVSRGANDVSLRVIGVDRRELRSIEALQSAITVGVTALVSGAVGWLAGEAYLTLGGHHELFLSAVLLSVALVGGLSVAAFALAAALVPRSIALELLRR